MPFFTVTTSFSVNRNEKDRVASTITELTVNNLKVAPDKVQVFIQTERKENFSRAGALLNNIDFSIASRKTNGLSEDSYFEGIPKKEDLIIIELDIWHNFSVNEKSNLGNEITTFLKEEFHLSGDNVLILIRDMEPANWIQNGISGINEDFLAKSRKV